MKYVLYHANCYDGFGAAYAAWKALDCPAKFIPVSYGQPPPNTQDADEIFILDFSYDAEVLMEMAKYAKVIVLDHHKTAEEKLKPLIGKQNPHVVFDMNRSGALMAWEYFHGDGFKDVPRLIKHISDRDLWKFEIYGSKEVHSALVSLPFDFDVWDRLDVDSLITVGAACLQFESSVVKKICSSAWIGKIDNFEVPIVNTAAHWSEVGHELLQLYPDNPFAACFTVMKNSTMWSLRGRGDFDVSEIAKKFGGGGHKSAAGFKTAKY
jgi:hypothetical protein